MKWGNTINKHGNTMNGDKNNVNGNVNYVNEYCEWRDKRLCIGVNVL